MEWLKQLHPIYRLNSPLTSIQCSEWNLAAVAAEGWICEGDRQEGEVRRICWNSTNQTVPRAAVQTFHRLSLETLCDVTFCVCAWKTVVGQKCWQTSLATVCEVSKGALVGEGLRWCQWVQEGEAEHWSDKLGFDQVKGWMYTQYDSE